MDQFFNPRTDISYAIRLKEMICFLRDDGVSYQLYNHNVKGPVFKDSLFFGYFNGKADFLQSTDVYRLDINWINSNSLPLMEKGQVAKKHFHYYNSIVPNGIFNVQNFEDVVYKNLYDGIDLKWYVKNGNLEYDFMVQPGTGYQQIKWEIEGAVSLGINETGDLVIETPYGYVLEEKPTAFQINTELAVEWKINGNEISFNIDEYDPNLPLVIDPLVRIWGSYFGGSFEDYIFDCTVDDSFNLYVVGTTSSLTSIATSGSHQSTIGGGTDAFISKFDSSGVNIWTTYYGGSANDGAFGCATDKFYNIYLVGRSRSTSAIATTGSHQSFNNGLDDGFLTKFSSSGIRQWSTYYGGTGNDGINRCVIDDSMNIYISGSTGSTSLITTTGAFKTTFGGLNDAFLAKFDSTGTRIWATYYGGSDHDLGSNCALDSLNNIYLCGNTGSSSGISTSGSHQSFKSGGIDAFLVKFNSGGSRIWATYVGGSGSEDRIYCATDRGTNIYLCGSTSSGSGISTATGHQVFLAGGTDGFLNKFNGSGTRIWGTYYGGVGNDYIHKCIVDGISNVNFAGQTYSYNQIATPGSYQSIYSGIGYDAFLSKFNPNGIRLWGTYYGGEDDDDGRTCAVDLLNNVYLAGFTKSTSNMASINCHQDTLSGIYDGFISKFNAYYCTSDSIFLSGLSACDSFVAPSGKNTWFSTGTFIDTLKNIKGCDSVLYFDLNFNYHNSNSITATSCVNYKTPSGKYIHSLSGLYQDTLQNSKGCDSIMSIQLTIKDVDISVTLNGNILTSNASATAYKWIDCKTNKLITGAINKSFTPELNGQYAVIVSQNGCIDTSDCFEVNNVGVFKNFSKENWLVIPNPSSGEITILLRYHPNGEFEIYSGLGLRVYAVKQKKQDQTVINLPEYLNTGVYLLKYSSDDFQGSLSIILNR